MTDDIINLLNIAVIALDDRLRLRFLNTSAESLLEVSVNRARDQRLSDVFQLADELEATLKEALASGQSYTGRKVRFELLSGNFITCDYFITPGNESAGAVIELYPLDRYLKIDRDESVTTQHQASRQMIRGLAHEIKNPLGGIRGSAQLLERELQTAELKSYTEIIIDETDRLTALVDRLLGPKNLPRPTPHNIHEVLERVRKLIELESKPPIRIRPDYDPSIPLITVDPELMVQVFLNIARNGMQSLGKVKLPQLTFRTRIERQFTIATTQHRLVAKIDIVDNGDGIPEELKEHLFYPMITGRSDGTGLGLSVAQSIIQQHNGLIEFESQPGETTFSIILPLESTL